MPTLPKYEPLRAYLASQPPEVAELTLTFAELTALLGAPLPATARLRSFWTNQRDVLRSTPRVRAWQAAGWRVRTAAPGVWVAFARAPPAGPP